MTPRSSPHLGADVRRFSRRWWLMHLHNFFWIALTSILIWVYADIEYTDSSRTLMLLSPREHTLSFELSGSKSSLKEFAEDLAEKGSQLTFDISQEYGPEDRFIPTADLLRKAGELRKRGIDIVSVSPEAIEIELDRLIRITDVPVELEYTGAELDAPPEPQTVNILVPQSRWEQLPPRLKERPRLKTRPQDLSTLQAGKTVPITAAVHPFISDIRVEVEPPEVTFSVQVKSRTVSETLPVSVKILAPTEWAETGDTTWQEYELVRQSPADWQLKLMLVGAKKDIKPENVQAFIELNDGDKKPVESWLERDVQVRFSPESNLRLAGTAPKLKFRLQKRQPLSTVP